MTRLTALLLATAALTAPTVAADFLATPEPLILSDVRVTDWTGFYVGVFGGVAFNPDEPGVIEFDIDGDGTFGDTLPTGGGGPPFVDLGDAFGDNFTGSNDAGFTGGIEVGYDYQISNFVIGAVADIAYVDYSESQQAFSATTATYSEDREIEYLGTLRARAGLLVTDDLLAYVHGGLAIGNVEYEFNSTNPIGVSSGDDDDLDVGYQVGAGVQAKVTESISLGMEYAYTNLGESDFSTNFDSESGPFVDGADLRGSDRDFDFHTVKASVKYHF